MIPTPEAFVKFLTHRAGKPLDLRKLMDRFDITREGEGAFIAFLDERVAAGEVVLIKGGRYAHPSRVGLVVGRLTVHPDGFGFVIADDGETPDLHVKGRNMKSAMHGDRIVARVEERGGRPSGRIIRILARSNDRIIGKLRVRRRNAVVVPLNERIPQHILIDSDDLMGAAEGQIVEVEITRFPTEDSSPEGKITVVVGYPGDADVEAEAIALKQRIPIRFEESVIVEAAQLPKKVRDSDTKGRKALLDVEFVTIDGETAKDFDDAVHVEKLKNGYLLRVAIADVSHYVTPGSEVDDEALARATSTYFPDRVFPMLPESISNGLCSLVPGEKRLAFVAEMQYSRGGRPGAARFFPTVIKSRHRLTYTEVARVLDDPDSEEAVRLGPTAHGLELMWELAERIRSRRYDRGSIDFDLPEAEIILDLRGKPEDIVKSERNRAHFLIEEFMIAANEAVAAFFEAKAIPAPFRIHEPPDPDDVEEFRSFIHNFGYTLKGRAKVHPEDYQDLVSQSEGKPEARVIRQMLLRSMKKAVYSPFNEGHFGLASENYLHFTSPIRRYPDLIVHRTLKQFCTGKKPAKKWRERELEYLERECVRLSERERAAEVAEREAVARLKCLFMDDKTGEEFWGIITGTASFGFFVELEQFFVDGLVHVSSLDDDFYHYSEQTHSLIGERTRRCYGMGDRVRVVVERVNVDKRQIDFKTVRDESGGKGKSKGKVKVKGKGKG